jgi:predicted PurR-regulated permease PerM
VLKVELTEKPLALAVLIGFAIYLALQFIALTSWVWIGFLLALILAAAMMPIVRMIEKPGFPPGRWHIPMGVAVILTLLAIAILGSVAAYVIGGLVSMELQTVSSSLPSLTASRLNDLADALNRAGFPPTLLPSPVSVVGAVRQVTRDALSFVAAAIPNFVTFFVRFFTVLTLAAFLVVESESALEFAVSLFPPAHRGLARDLMVRSGQTMGYWVLGTLTQSALVGVLSGLAAWLLGLPGPALIGVLAGIIQFIPITGAILMVIPAFFLGMLQSPAVAGAAVVAYALIAELNAAVFTPIISRWSVSLSPIIVIIAIPLGAELFGAVGGLMGIPVAAAVQIFVTGAVLPWLHRLQGEPSVVSDRTLETPRDRAA